MPPSERLRFRQSHPSDSALWPAGEPPRGVLVLIHAFPLNARMWAPQFALADAGWHVVAPQLRGFDEPHAAVSPEMHMEDYAGDVADLVEGLGSGPAVIGGLSMGGYVALELYRRHPGLFRGLVLADTRAEADTADARRNRERMIELARTGGAAAVADEMLPKLLGSATRAQRPDVEAHVRSLILSSGPTAIISALHAMMTRSDSVPLLPSITVPTLVAVGADDGLTPPTLSSAMAEAIAGATMVVVPEAGHLASLEQPSFFNAALAAFLQRV